MASTDIFTPVLQTYSVLAISLAAGTQLSTSIASIPALLQAPPLTLAVQWKTLFDRAITPVLTCTLTSSVGFGLLAYRAAYPASTTPAGLSAPRAPNLAKRNLYLVAAMAAFGLVPYTRLLMWDNIARLERLAEVAGMGAGANGSKETATLVEQWGTLNFYRGCLLLSSAVAGTWAGVV